MSLAKTAADVDLMAGATEGPVVITDDLMAEDYDLISDLMVANEDEDNEPHLHGEGTVLIKIDDQPEMEKEFSFTLPLVPGGEDQSEIEEDVAELSVEEPDDKISVELDPWDWQSKGLNNFMPWLSSMMKNVPSHSGVDTAGLERAMAYLDTLDRSISKAVRSDLKNELDVAQVERAREEIRKGVERLEDRLDKITRNKYKGKGKKKADEEESSLVKQAQKIWGVKGLMVTVPLLISRIARVCINGQVSAGRDIEDTFKDQVKKYSLDKREQATLVQLLEDMGYPVRRDRGFLLDEDIDSTSENGKDWMPNYNA